MTAIWICITLLALPSLCVRVAILRCKLSKRVALSISYLTGFCQDFFIAFEQVFLIVLLRIFLPTWAIPSLFWVAVVFSSLVQLHLIFDAFLYRKAAIRMELSFLSLIDEARFFWDSAKEKKIYRFLPAALLFCLLPLLAYWNVWNQLIEEPLMGNWVGVGFLLGGMGMLGALLLPKKLAYATDQIAFQHQVWQLQKLWKFLCQRKNHPDLDTLIHTHFTPHNEKKGYPSSEYPLLKYTHGFTGERSFEIALGEKGKPHLIFLFLESFRSRDVGILGGKYSVTPHFDRLARQGVLFSNFYSNSIRTSRAVISSLFGVPSDVDASEVATRTDTPFIGLPQLLTDAGYATRYFHNGPIQFEKQEAFFKHQNYQTIVGQDDILRLFPEGYANSWGVLDEYLMRYTLDFLDKERDHPQFLTLFTISNHHPWRIKTDQKPPSFPEEIGETYRNYLTTFHYTDACLGLLIEGLKKRNLSRDVILFVMGDHGYPMGEHDNYVEQRYLYEENIRVPLLVYADGRITNSQVIHSPASQLDLVPTVMDLLGLHGFNLSIGSSLMRKLNSRPVFFHNPYVFRNFGCREGNYKCIYTHLSSEVELYDLSRDPEEKENIAPYERNLVDKHLLALKEYQAAFNRLYREKRLAPTEALNAEEIHFTGRLADFS